MIRRSVVGINNNNPNITVSTSGLINQSRNSSEDNLVIAAVSSLSASASAASALPSASTVIFHNNKDDDNDNGDQKKKYSTITMWSKISGYMNSTRLIVLLVLCLQNSLYTVIRRYSQGVLKENYSKVR